MARIELKNIAHSYHPNPGDQQAGDQQDWALKPLDVTFEDGGAYALLGPSGCGKTTLLNIISGLLKPSEGAVLFGDDDVTALAPEYRHIAQIFQFPVIYDTMSVYDNLAFPLKNLRMDKSVIAARVEEIAELTDLTSILKRRAAGLGADEKQKISLARGLVRDDVNVIMLDEPLTSIDPQQKWKLRSKLKELHQKINVTMIYVTHDQTEALTFADKVIVMNFGEILQTGTPIELFNRPNHAFVGYFIGSPGMNFIRCTHKGGKIYVGENEIATANAVSKKLNGGGEGLQIGVRPECVIVKEKGGKKDIPAQVKNIINIGKNYLFDVEVTDGGGNRYIVKATGTSKPKSNSVHIAFAKDYCYLYHNGYLL